MAPQGVRGQSEKENRPQREALLGQSKDKTVAGARTARPLGQAGHGNAPLAEEKPQSRVGPRAAQQAPPPQTARRPLVRTATAAAPPPRAASAPRSGCSTPRTAPGTPRGTNSRSTLASRRSADPWAEVKASAREADKAEAELAALEQELEAQEAAVREQEAVADEAEQELTTQSASILASYAARHEETKGLEGELAALRTALEEQRAGNLGRSRQSLELDRKDNACVQEISEAEALLEKCSRSHGDLDAEIERRRAACDEEREACRKQAARLEADLTRFAKSRARLLEVQSVPTSLGEADNLLQEANTIMTSFRQAWTECQEVVRSGVVIKDVSSAAEVPQEQQVARPGRWRSQQQAAQADAVVMPALPAAADNPLVAESQDQAGPK